MSTVCCTEYKCLAVYVAPCAASLDTGLTADVAGTWRAMIEFNGSWTNVKLGLDIGDAILLPNRLNTHYKHQLKIYKPNGELYMDTCYILDVKMTFDAIDGNAPAPVTTGGQEVTTDIVYTIKDAPDPNNTRELQSGNMIVLSTLAGLPVHRPQFLNWQAVNIPYTQSTGTFDNTANGGFLNEDNFLISYEKPV